MSTRNHTQPMPETANCPKCGKELRINLRPETQHYGEIRCPFHGHQWIGKPAEGKKPKRKDNADLIPLLPQGRQHYCWTCLREKELLKSLRPSVSLNVHHIIEVRHGGTDDPVNLYLACGECHSEIHRRREAFNRYENRDALSQ
jgi:5-methylcytosine-specific restriction endonuclease McrA